MGPASEPPPDEPPDIRGPRARVLDIDSRLLSLTAQLALFLYFTITEWVDVSPWNNVRDGRAWTGLDAALVVAMLVAMLCTVRRWRVGISLAGAFYAIWLAVQVVMFWWPYLHGASPAWQRRYATEFATNFQWLPRRGAHLPPDASHIVMQLLLAGTLRSTLFAGLSAWRGSIDESTSRSTGSS